MKAALFAADALSRPFNGSDAPMLAPTRGAAHSAQSFPG